MRQESNHFISFVVREHHKTSSHFPSSFKAIKTNCISNIFYESITAESARRMQGRSWQISSARELGQEVRPTLSNQAPLCTKHSDITATQSTEPNNRTSRFSHLDGLGSYNRTNVRDENDANNGDYSL
jgi:hypothetical protein